MTESDPQRVNTMIPRWCALTQLPIPACMGSCVGHASYGLPCSYPLNLEEGREGAGDPCKACVQCQALRALPAALSALVGRGAQWTVPTAPWALSL